jgi:hypothetical protein
VAPALLTASAGLVLPLYVLLQNALAARLAFGAAASHSYCLTSLCF